MRIIYLTAPIIAAVLMGGCANRESILVPGQIKSDCEDRASNLGVCATPKTVYQNKDKIGKIYYEEGEAYYVKKNGKVYNVDTDEEVIPGKKPDGCGKSICMNCDEESGSGEDWSRKHLIKFKGRSVSLATAQRTSSLRDLGWQQEIWIAPYVNKADDLIEAHRIHVVVKKPSWVIGEKRPSNVNRAVVVPSLIAKEVLRDNHEAINRTTNETIRGYVSSKDVQQLQSIKKYIMEQKKRGEK